VKNNQNGIATELPHNANQTQKKNDSRYQLDDVGDLSIGNNKPNPLKATPKGLQNIHGKWFTSKILQPNDWNIGTERVCYPNHSSPAVLIIEGSVKLKF
jgi:hypothetical protein